mmetsp:Transcript_93100/g.272445  ORF Transcript_93100/g.272445 Transcript_93100/m.272445 type:complete len:267 (-) Transcript_93100:48-848(-)
MICPLVGSFSCRWMCSTISHSGPRPRGSPISGRCLYSVAACPTASALACPRPAAPAATVAESRCHASAITLPSCFAASSSCLDVRVTRRWKSRHGMWRERNFTGICFSCRFRSLRKPATLISMYCACVFATSTRAWYWEEMVCSCRAMPRGSARSFRCRSSRQSAARSSGTCGSARSRRSSRASSMSSPASLAAPWTAATRAARRASPARTCARMRAMSSSTRLKSWRSSEETRSSSSASSAGEAAGPAGGAPARHAASEPWHVAW